MRAPDDDHTALTQPTDDVLSRFGTTLRHRDRKPMHFSRPLVRSFGALATIILLATACGGSGDSSTDSSTPTGALSGISPATVVIQADWFPEAEHGAVYEMLGDDYSADAETKRVRGSLLDADRVDTGVDLEIRSGGPAIGGLRVVEAMATDDDITLGFVNTDSAAFNYETIPTIAVVATLDKSPQMIMWDPETYPDVTSIADIGRAGITVNVFSAGTFLDVFVATGVLNQDQLDPSYDGSPGRFIAEGGTIAQQGFASAEPYLYEKVFSDWGKPVAYQLLHDAGYQSYAQPLAIRAADKEALAPCLKKLVPIIQRSAAAYVEDGERANDIIVDAVAKFDTFWVYEKGVADFSTKVQRDLELVGNGDDDTIGNFDFERAEQVLDQLRDAGLDVPTDLTADMIYTNEFIDPSIGL